jgi:hypothetical protein
MAEEEFPTFEEFCLNVTLYKPYNYDMNRIEMIADFHYLYITFDNYCID